MVQSTEIILIQTDSNCTQDEPGAEEKVFDDDYNERENEKVKRRIKWPLLIYLLMNHMLAFYYWLGLIGLDSSMTYRQVFIQCMMFEVFGRISGMGMLAGQHRLWSHRSYKARLPLSIALMLMQTMSGQWDIFWWARDHRIHHKYSDTNSDPHGTHRGLFFAHIGWLFTSRHPEVVRKGKSIDVSDLLSDPVVQFQRRYYVPLWALMWLLLPMYLSHYATGYPLWQCFQSAVVLRFVVSLHYIFGVNSLAHRYGYRPYDKSLMSTENYWVGYLVLGDCYHNYHHTFPYDYSGSEHGWRHTFNIGTAFIDFCAWLGLAYDLKKPSPELIEKRVKRTGDESLLRELRRQHQRPLYVFIDYFIGLVFSFWITILTLFIRFIIQQQQTE